jgi:hypothetical protein
MNTSTNTAMGNSSSSNVGKALGQLANRSGSNDQNRRGLPALNVTPRFIESRLKQFVSR